jgi:opacity protein-like surface antigen
MNCKKLLAITLLCSTITPYVAHAAEKTPLNSSGVYFRADTGPSISKDAGTAPIVGLGVGYRINEHLRVDATLAHRGTFEADEQGTIYGADVRGTSSGSAITGMINAYGDIATVGIFTPYVGAGIGLSQNKLKGLKGTWNDGTDTGAVSTDGKTTTSFAWQVGAGTAVSLTDNLSLDVGYRFLNIGAYKSSDSISAQNTPYGDITLPLTSQKQKEYAHEVQMGLRYAF